MPNEPRVALRLELEWPFKRHAELFAGTQRYARERGWRSIIAEFVEHELPARRTGRPPFDGIIARANTRLVDRCAALGIPLVNVLASSPARDRVPGVFPDAAAAGRMQAEHLLARGLQSFVALVMRSDWVDRVGVAAFRATVEAAGCRCIASPVPLGMATHRQWEVMKSRVIEAMQSWEPPLGVVVGHDNLGRLVAQLCGDRGWRVPRDVAIVTGGNEETLCENPRPSLTSVEFGFDRIGYEAARMLDRLMSTRRGNGRGTEVEHLLLPPVGIVPRESTDVYVVDEPSVAAALAFLAANAHRSIAPPDVARAATTELRTLQRRFRKHLGRSIVEEIRRMRFERARRELAFSNQPIAAVASAAGFENAKQMAETFRRELGVPPTEYRRRRRAGS